MPPPAPPSLAAPTAQAIYDEVTVRFAPVIECESARWGDCAAAAAYRADSFTPPGGSLQRGWNENTSQSRNTFLSNRAALMLTWLRAANLYPPAP